MRGITEERLKEKINDPYWSTHNRKELFTALLSECTELNAWQPIDENTPKDKNILVYDPGYGQLVVIWSEFYSLWITVFGRKLLQPPTHWQELPKDPK
jgi:hypothetical protein